MNSIKSKGLNVENVINVHIINIYPHAIVPLVSACVAGIISMNAFVRSYRNHFAFYIFLLSLFLAMWTGSNAVLVMTPYLHLAVFFKNIYFVCWMLIPPLYLLEALIFAKKRKRDSIWAFILSLAALAVIFRFDLSTVVLTYFGYFPHLAGLAGAAVFVMWYSIILLGLVILYDEYRHAETNTRRNQARILWLGTSTGFSMTIPENLYMVSGNSVSFFSEFPVDSFYNNLFILLAAIVLYVFVLFIYTALFRDRHKILDSVKYPLVIIFILAPACAFFLSGAMRYFYAVYPVSGIGVIISAICVLYASMRYRLMAIGDVFQKYFIYYFIVIIFFAAYISMVRSIVNIDMMVPAILLAMIMVIIFNPVYNAAQNITDRFLFSSRLDYQKTIRNLSSQLVTVLDYDRIILLLKETIIDTMRASSFILLLYDQEKEEYTVAAHHGEVPVKDIRYNSTDPSIQLIKLANSEIFKEDIVDDYSGYDIKEYASLFDDLDVVIVIPMTYKGVLRGIICLGDKKGHHIYTDMDVYLLSILANQAVIALDNARLYEMAMTDELTNLYITRFFNQRIVDEISGSIRSGRKLSLLMIDVDHFKMINDTYGHQRGNDVLKDIALIIEEQVRAVDLVARYGGEEFAIILPEADNEKAFNIAERVRMKIEGHVFAGNISMTVSIGVSTINGKMVSKEVENARSYTAQKRRRFFTGIKEKFLYHADQALYMAKQQGRNRTINNNYLEI